MQNIDFRVKMPKSISNSDGTVNEALTAKAAA
jgi:hypothetical protein